MALVLLNMIIIIGYSVHAMRGRRGWVGLLTLVATMAAFSLGRTRLSLSVPMDQMRLTIVDLFPFAILPVWLMPWRKIRRNVMPLLGLIFLTTFVSLLAFLLKGRSVAWAAYSWIYFVGPMFLGVYAGSLDRDDAYALGDNVEKIILVLAVIGIVSTQLVPATIADFLGWERGEAGRLFTPVGTSVRSGATMLLIWPSILSQFLTKRSLLSFCKVSLLIVAFLVTGSRAIIAAFALVALLTVLLDVFSQLNARKVLAVSRKAIIVLSLFGLGVCLFGQAPYVRRLWIGFSDTSSLMRFESFRTAAQLVVERPLIGHVPGHTYSWFHTDYDDITQTWIWLGHGASLPQPHNTYLMIAVDYGVLVLAYFTAIMGHMIATQVKRGLIRRANFGVYYSLGIFAFLIQAFASGVLLTTPQVAALFWLLYGSSAASIGYAINSQ